MKRKRILIVGAGFTGLSAALELSSHDNDITIIEKESQAGGLAQGFKSNNWDWAIEQHYHHFFASDKSILRLANLVSANYSLTNANTSIWDGEIFAKFDTPFAVIKYPKLSLISKMRLLIGLGVIKIIPRGMWLDKWKAIYLIKRLMGTTVYNFLWKPLFISKFTQYYNQVNGSWFWSRIKARTSKLGYFDNGFRGLINKILLDLDNRGVKIIYNTKLEKLESLNQGVKAYYNNIIEEFDQILITLPYKFTSSLLKNSSIKQTIDHPGLGAITLILELNKQYLDDIYWLNILDKSFPFLVVVEHTNWQNPKYYDNKHIVYFGKYLNIDDKIMSYSKEQLIEYYLPFIKKVNPLFESNWITQSWIFKSNYAQPIFPLNHSKNIPSMIVEPTKIYWCSIDHIYPWDRGTNFAIEWGQKVAKLMINNK